jgi:Rad3-related DNA helicase
MSLKEYWPFPSFRGGQESVLDQIEEAWETNDVIVVRAPTAFGKAPTAVTIQNWALSQGLSSAITEPNNNLRKQMLDDYSHLVTVRAMDDYWIEKYQMTEKEFRQKHYKWGPKGSEYNTDLKRVKRVGEPICVNYHSYIAHKLQRNVVIVDEAHLLLGTLQDFAARKIWRHKFPYPSSVRTLAQLKAWAQQGPDTSTFRQLRDELNALTPSTLIQVTTDLYRGVEKQCIKLIPLSVENSPPIFWPSKTQKIILVSATLGLSDIERMGLSNRRVKIIDAPSPIPAERRGVHLSYIGNMSYASQDGNLDALIQKIKELRESNEGNGFVHASYSLAQKIKYRAKDCDWMVFHDRDPKRKQEAYDKFANTPAIDRKVMVGSGFTEGVDMKYDVANWQAIAKIPYPSLGDPAMRWVAQNKGDIYNWMVSRDIMQAAGRVCRAPDDIGLTYILDNSWDRWYQKALPTLPQWFKEAVI